MSDGNNVSDTLTVHAPVDSLDRDSTLRKVSLALFGEHTQAPRVGNYFLLEKIGEGAMGVVYAAYDPDLDRRVAIKLLRTRGDGPDQDSQHLRLVREARSLAKLSHANVVTVYGVGDSERGAYVAMEYVQGADLAQWFVEQPRGWREVLEAYLQAARGLAAAHRAGIVHRDFKPHNVLLGADGVVRVADFGLARLQTDPDPDVSDAMKSGSGDCTELTQTGGVLGTPRYMAPEQHRGETLGATADQYAYCASLYEGLYGEPPFAATSSAALLEAKLGRNIKRPAGVGVPRWLVHVVERGLEPDPAARYDSMDTLIAAVERGRRRGVRIAVGAVGLGTTVLAAFAFAGMLPGETPQTVTSCTNAQRHLQGVWDASLRSAARGTILASDVSYAEHTALRVVAQLDQYAEAWTDSKTRACLAHEAEDESDALFDRRNECLDIRLAGLGAVASALADEEAGVVDRAQDLTNAMRSVAHCDAPASVLTQPTRGADAGQRAASAQTRAEVIRLQALIGLGRTSEAAAGARELESQLDTLLDNVARAEVQQLLASVSPNKADKIAIARRGLHDAIRSRDEMLIVRSYTMLVTHLRYSSEYEDALEELDTAAAIVDRAMETSEDPSWQAQLRGMRGEFENQYGMVYSEQGQHATGERHYQRSLHLSEALAEQRPDRRIVILNNYAELLRKTGRYDEAVELYDSAQTLAHAVYGEDHPTSCMIVGNRASALLEMGHLTAARADLEHNLAVYRSRVGPRHVQVGLSDFNLALIALNVGDLERAGALLDEARSIFEAFAGGKPSELVGISLAMRGAVERARGELGTAAATAQRSVTMLREHLPGPHELLATGLSEQGTTLYESGEYEAAQRALTEALEVFEASVGSTTPAAATTQALLAATLHRRGKLGQSQRLFTEAQANFQPFPEHPALALTLLLHAQLLSAQGDSDATRRTLRRGLAIATAEALDPVVEGRICAALADVVDAPQRANLLARARKKFAAAGARSDRYAQSLAAPITTPR